MPEPIKTTSSVLIVAVCAESARKALIDRNANAIFVSGTTGASYELSLVLVVAISALQIVSAATIVVPTTTWNARVSKCAGFATMLFLLVLELLLRVVSKDVTTFYRCIFSASACALRLVDALSSHEKRLFSGFVGQVEDEYHFVDVLVGRLREGATRYKLASLAKVFTVGVFIHAALNRDMMMFPKSALKRQLARTNWMVALSMLAFAYTIAMFDRTHAKNRKKFY